MRSRSLRAAVERGFVACEIGNTVYAISIDYVQEIVLPSQLTPIPHCPPGVLGAMDHRGEVVPIFDMGVRLGFGPVMQPRRKWVLVRAEGKTAGLVVSRVREVFRVTEGDLRQAPEMAGAEERSASQIVPYDGHLAYVLEMSTMTAAAERALPSREPV